MNYEIEISPRNQVRLWQGERVMGSGGNMLGQLQGAAVAREASMSHAIEQFDPIIKHLHETKDALGQILSRVFGPHPTAVTENSDEAPLPSMIANLTVRATYLSRVVDEIAELTRRLDQVL